MATSGSPPDDGARFLVFASAFFLLWFLGLYLAFRSTGFGEREEQSIYILFFLSAPLCAAIAVWWKPLSSAPADRWPFGNAQTAMLSTALPSLILAWGLKGIDIALYHNEYETPAFSPGRFAAGVLVTSVACLAAIFMHKRASPGRSEKSLPGCFRARILGYGLGFLLLLSLFDIHITLDTLSYDPYVGPAAAVLHGAIPFVDVFSQYGLNFLLFAAVLKVLPWSMFSTTLVVALLNVAY